MNGLINLQIVKIEKIINNISYQKNKQIIRLAKRRETLMQSLQIHSTAGQLNFAEPKKPAQMSIEFLNSENFNAPTKTVENNKFFEESHQK